MEQLFGITPKPEVEEGPSWFERQLKGASRTGGILAGTAYSVVGFPFAIGAISAISPPEGESTDSKYAGKGITTDSKFIKMLPTQLQPFALAAGAFSHVPIDPKLAKLPWWQQSLEAARGGLSNTWDAMTKPGTFGITWGEYYKKVTGKELNHDLRETFADWGVPDPVTLANQVAPTIEAMIEIAGDQLLWQGSAARQLMLTIPKNFIGKLGAKESVELVQQLQKLDSVQRASDKAEVFRKGLKQRFNIFTEIQQKLGKPEVSFDQWRRQQMLNRSGGQAYDEGFKPFKSEDWHKHSRSGGQILDAAPPPKTVPTPKPSWRDEAIGAMKTELGPTEYLASRGMGASAARADRVWRDQAIATMKQELSPPVVPPRSGAMLDEVTGFQPKPTPVQRTVHHAKPVRREPGEIVRGTPPAGRVRPPEIDQMIEPMRENDVPDMIRYAYERTAKRYELWAEEAADSGTDALTFLHRVRKDLGISNSLKAEPTAVFTATLDELTKDISQNMEDFRHLIPDELFEGMSRVYGEGVTLDALSSYAGRAKPGFGAVSNVTQLEKLLMKFKPGQTIKGVGQVLYLDKNAEGRILVALKDTKTGRVVHKPIDEVLKAHRAADPSVTLDMLGFQQIWEKTRSWLEDFSVAMKALGYQHPNYYDHMATPDAKQIVRQRVMRDGSVTPGVTGAERNVMMNIVEPETSPFQKKYFKGEFHENAPRIFEELDPSGRLAEMFMWPMVEGDDMIFRERKIWKAILKTWRKMSTEEAKKMLAYAIGEQANGLQRLAQAGIKQKVTWNQLGKETQQTYLAMREAYEKLFHRLNGARKLAGKAELKYEQNYFTFANDMNEITKAGENIVAAPLTRLSRYLAPRTGPGFPYEKLRMPPKGRQAQMTRLGKDVAPLEMNPFKTFDRYVNSALDAIHKQPHIAKMNELLGTFNIKDATGKVHRWSLSQTHPHAARFLREFTDFNSGFRARWFFEHTAFDKILSGLTNNLTASILGANLRSALIQPTALKNTWMYTSTRDTAGGISDFLQTIVDPKKKAFIDTHSRTIKSRQMETAFSDLIERTFSSSLRDKVGEKWNMAGKMSLIGLQLLDNCTAQATWWAGYRYAQRNAKRLRLKTTKDFTRYADDVVLRTQASSSKAVRSKLQRHTLGKALTLFQTFVINDMNLLIKDVIGVRRSIPKKERALRLFKYMFSSWFVNWFYEDVLNVNSPLPTPIRAFNEAYERGSDYPSLDGAWAATKEIASGFPVLSFMRWGGSLAGAVGTTIEDMAKGDVSSMLTSTGLPAVSQGRKTIRAWQRDDTTWAHLAGKPTPPPPKWESGWRGGGMESGWKSGWD